MNIDNLKAVVPSCNYFYGPVPESKADLLAGNSQASIGAGNVVYCFAEPVRGLEEFLLNDSKLEAVIPIIEEAPVSVEE
jgi:hypothetical protein